MNLSVNSNTIGWSLLFSGIVFVLSFVFLALMFSTRKFPWGPLNDVSYVIALILIVPFLIGFYYDQKIITPIASIIAVTLGVMGILLITITQMRLVFHNIEFELNLRQGAFGSGLLGTAFIINHLIHLNASLIPAGLNWLGLISGVFMAFGIPTGLFYGKEELEMTTGKFDWKNTNKMAVTAVVSTFIGQIGLIVFAFGLGIKLISF